MNKILRKVVWVLGFLVLGCQNSTDTSVNRIDQSEKTDSLEVTKEIENKNPTVFSKEIMEILTSYSKEYPIDVKLDSPFVPLSYNLTFIKMDGDTIIGVTKQPYLFELFPDFAFDKNNLESHYTPKGITFWDSIPVVVYDDSTSVGKGYYKENELTNPVPKKYKITSLEYVHLYVTPFWKYKVSGGEFELIEKTDSLYLQ